jgi:hypothetical protein
MTRKWLTFDLEIAALIQEDETDWKQYRPLGITCVGLAYTNDKGDIRALSLCGEESGNDTPLPRMTQADCQEIVRRLQRAIEKGYTILTWNGLSFDFDVLAEESGMFGECVELAMNHVDAMLHVHCIKGYPIGLDAVAKGLGLTGKTEGVSGAKAPHLWAQGEYETVLQYVEQDVRTTLEVALEVERRRGLTWISKSGRRNALPLQKWLTVAEALQLPEPNTSWMSDPLPRAKFTSWMDAPVAVVEN